MEPIIDHPSLASYLLRPDLDESATRTVLTLTNRRIREIVGDLADVPAEVESFALEVAARAIRPNLDSSVTISSGGTSKTTRRDTPAVTGAGAGVYVTETEDRRLLELIGQAPPPRRRPRSIRTFVP